MVFDVCWPKQTSGGHIGEGYICGVLPSPRLSLPRTSKNPGRSTQPVGSESRSPRPCRPARTNHTWHGVAGARPGVGGGHRWVSPPPAPHHPHRYVFKVDGKWGICLSTSHHRTFPYLFGAVLGQKFPFLLSVQKAYWPIGLKWSKMARNGRQWFENC